MDSGEDVDFTERLIEKYFSKGDFNFKLLRQIITNLRISNLPIKFDNVCAKEVYEKEQDFITYIIKIYSMGPIFDPIIIQEEVSLFQIKVIIIYLER